MKKYDYILFDLDGTLSASAEGIKASLKHCIEGLKCKSFDLENYPLYIGPPLVNTFAELCDVPTERLDEAMDMYREYYAEVGIKYNRVFDGSFEMLTRLRENGCKIAICTSKNEPVAEDVANMLGLTEYVDAICGSSEDGSIKEKVDLIPYAMRTLGCGDKSKAVMIGDTHFDAKGAKIAGVDFVGVSYGYGTNESMESYGAKAIVDTPEELTAYLLGE